MDRGAVLAAFDEQIRRHPEPDAPDARIEHDAGVIRRVAGGDGWNGVIWSRLDRSTADAIIAAQISRFAELSRPWEWKHYSHDQPPDLPDRLLAAGFTREPAEALLVAEIADLALDVPPPPGVELRAFTDQEGVAALVAVLDAVFGEDHSVLGKTLLTALGHQPRTVAAVVAFAAETPVAAGRVEFRPGTDFAGLWGGATVPARRGRGVFRSLVAHRAALASTRGLPLPPGRRLGGQPADPPAAGPRRARLPGRRADPIGTAGLAPGWMRERGRGKGPREAQDVASRQSCRAGRIPSMVMRGNSMVLWTLVAFFAGTLLFGGLRRATEDSSTAVTVLVQVGALAVVIGIVLLIVRRFR